MFLLAPEAEQERDRKHQLGLLTLNLQSSEHFIHQYKEPTNSRKENESKTRRESRILKARLFLYLEHTRILKDLQRRVGKK
jgi:hypothetical protein